MDKREKIMEDFAYFARKVARLVEDDTTTDNYLERQPFVLATAAHLVQANEMRKLEAGVYSGIKDLVAMNQQAQGGF